MIAYVNRNDINFQISSLTYYFKFAITISPRKARPFFSSAVTTKAEGYKIETTVIKNNFQPTR